MWHQLANITVVSASFESQGSDSKLWIRAATAEGLKTKLFFAQITHKATGRLDFHWKRKKSPMPAETGTDHLNNHVFILILAHNGLFILQT